MWPSRQLSPMQPSAFLERVEPNQPIAALRYQAVFKTSALD